MLVNTVCSLLFIGLIALIRVRHRLDKVIVPLITFATVGVFYLFCLDKRIGTEVVNTLIWDSSRSGDIKIDIVSSINNYQLIFPFFIITILALFNNLFFRYEQRIVKDSSYEYGILVDIDLISAEKIDTPICADKKTTMDDILIFPTNMFK